MRFSAPIADAPADLQLAPPVARLRTRVARAGGNELIDGIEHALAGAAVAIRMNGVGVLADRVHQVCRPRQRALDRRQQQLGLVDIDQLRSGPAVLESDHRLVRQQELVQCR